jgi:hypothetical protein
MVGSGDWEWSLVAQRLPSMGKAMGLNPSTKTKQKKKKK